MHLKSGVLILLCGVNAVRNLAPKTLQLRQNALKVNYTKSNETMATKFLSGSQGLGEGGMPIFQLLVREWTKVPDLGKFTERCEKLISKLLPKLRNEYTGFQVPKVLLHDCDVYWTKDDYRTNNTNEETARYQCRYSARKLGEEFFGDKDYKGWCTDLHEYLTEQQNLHVQMAERQKLFDEQDALRKELDKLRQQYEDMMKKKGKITAELDALGKELHADLSLPCCPNDCRICTPAEMAAEGNKSKAFF